MILQAPMNDFMLKDYITVEKVVDGVATLTVRLPVEMLDDVTALANHILHVSRWVKVRNRMTDLHGNKKRCVEIASFPSKWKRVNG